ncbi:MAG: Stk1 family PASTA domain-containing Ser/Thr kinase [Lachnospiraceae bacterium]|nr:Stk1 family PASTA domain-containing Ser/Thr kinase [Lachnospiraceae bacterium]
MIQPGMFISDRYEIIDKVGSGGMADVYKAKCHRLNRYVAIKILKAEFSSDTGFVQKFRAEAQSVAGLSHPNIVSVYDVGDDDGLHYIVMELVEGITLKRFIERKKGLDVKEAVGIAIQIAQGMEAAHSHHIIHRDIKPQNIIISREGKVKVADFGIAKAATSNTISQNAIGSVHYLSPEQARGGYSDERSDIYSLGVTLYEMLTGQVPFAGDNSVSVALLHIQSEATPVQVLNPEVPTSVDRIVQKCMQKKPERRYQSAAELIRDLKRSILNPDGDYVNISSSAAVTNSPTRPMTEDEMETIKSAAKSPVVYFDNNTINQPRPQGEYYENPPKKKADKASRNPNAKHVQKEVEEIDSMNSTLEKILAIVSILFAIALIVFIFYFLKKYFFNGEEAGNNNQPTSMESLSGTPDPYNNGQSNKPDSPTPTNDKIIPTSTPTPILPTATPDPESETFPMPQVMGLMVEDAIKRIRLYAPDIEIDWSHEEFSNEYKKDLVSAQYPDPNVTFPKNGKVILTISAGKEPIELPDVVNKDFETARQLLTAKGFNVIALYEMNDDIDEGKVIRTEPEAPSMIEKDSDVTVYVSQGTDKVVVPSLKGKTVAEASAELAELGLFLGTPTEEYSKKKEGTILSQTIAAGTKVEAGTAIDYSVSIGKYVEPSPTDVPDDNGGDSGDNGGGSDDDNSPAG